MFKTWSETIQIAVKVGHIMHLKPQARFFVSHSGVGVYP